jgi:hypothetical protein
MLMGIYKYVTGFHNVNGSPVLADDLDVVILRASTADYPVSLGGAALLV